MPPGKHAVLSASSSHRWLNCNPSARLEQEFEDHETQAAAEGSAAHALAEHKLRKALKMRSRKPVSKYDSDEMDTYTDGYVEFVLEALEEAKQLCSDPKVLIEQKLDFSCYVPDGFGTGDCLIVADRLLHIIDLKYGQGVLVNAVENPQMMLYALGALRIFDCLYNICYEIHQKAKDIIEGRKIDHTFYPVIYGAEESDDWTDPETWKKANPSLGITVGIDKVKDACESAKQNPGEENAFRQLRLNQWVKQAVRWMPMDKWDKCEFAVSEDDLEGRVCYGGLDLSSTTDITAFVLVFPPLDEDDKYIVLPYFWIPEDNLDLRVRRDHVPYDVWERQGFLQTTEGNVVHYGYIEKFIEKLGERFNIREIAFDRWGTIQMVQNLEGMGFTVVPFGQGFKDMSPPISKN